MGKMISIFAGGKLHRQILDRIATLDMEPMNGNLYLRLTMTEGALPDWLPDWLMGEVIFRFIVNDGEETLTGLCPGIRYDSNEKGVYYPRIEFRDPETGNEILLGEWKTLEIILIAGKEEKSFTAQKADTNKEGNATPEVNETS